MNWRDKAILEKFCVKESSNLIGLEYFRPAGFSIIAVLGCLAPPPPPNSPPPPPPPPYESKSEQISTYQSSTPIFYILPMKALLKPIIT